MQENQIIILEHPSMMDMHVVAKVVAITGKMISVLYWNRARKSWSDEGPKRRKIGNGIVIVVGDVSEIDEPRLQRISEGLAAATSELKRQQSAAKTLYLDTLKNFPALYK